jgi:hypothetical protein
VNNHPIYEGSNDWSVGIVVVTAAGTDDDDAYPTSLWEDTCGVAWVRSGWVEYDLQTKESDG